MQASTDLKTDDHKTHCVVLCTCPDQTSAEQLAERLLNQRLVACINVLPTVTSLYHWQGELCRDHEVQLILKTRTELLVPLEAAIRAHHPYDVPEILALPVEWGHRPYLEWINQNCPL